MPTYTAVLVVPDELDQDYVHQQLERLGIVTFLGPGALVETGEDDEHGPTVLTGMDGLTVQASVTRTADGPMVRLAGRDCRLEGDAPGDYYLQPE